MDNSVVKLPVKSILVSQPEPTSENNPYLDISKKFNVKFDFRKFIQIEDVEAKEFRKSKIELEKHNAVVLTSKLAADHYFRICKEMRFIVPNEMKFYCINEATALYLQRHIQYRRRKISFPESGKSDDLSIMLKKNNKGNNYLFISSNLQTSPILEYMEREKLNHSDAILYKTTPSDLSDLSDITYDMLVFFSPEGLRSLFKNFPSFKQNNTRIGAFGEKTAEEVLAHNLRLDVVAPVAGVTSIFQALENYLKESNQ